MTAQTNRTRRSFVMEEAVAILARTPATLDAMLRGLPEGWIVAREGGETWSPFDVIGHLIHGERTDSELGVVTLCQLIATWAAHDLDHVAQISRVLARQYSDAVGPWRAYLRIIRGAQG